MRALVATALSAVLLPACISAAPRTTSLRVVGAPGDATVTIDDRFLGAFGYVAKKGVALPPGKHRITVEKTGFFSWDRLVEVHEGDPLIRLDVALVQIPD